VEAGGSLAAEVQNLPPPQACRLLDVSRRSERECRALLLTVLGEFVPARWRLGLDGDLSALGCSVSKRRRSPGHRPHGQPGWLEPERIGRRPAGISPEAAAKLLTDGPSGIYAFGREHRRWTALVLILATVPKPSGISATACGCAWAGPAFSVRPGRLDLAVIERQEEGVGSQPSCTS